MSESSPNKRVLLVEDEEIVRDVVAAMLMQHGYEVVAVESGPAALNECGDAADFDVLLTDLVMPAMNGIELAAAVQEQAPETRVVYMSGYSAEPAQNSAPRVQKPFTSGELLATIEAALS